MCTTVLLHGKAVVATQLLRGGREASVLQAVNPNARTVSVKGEGEHLTIDTVFM